jgi:uncharacterized protein (DUF427 family)
MAPGSIGPMTVRALFNETVIAESDDTVVVEGNHYFPIADVDRSYLEDSPTHTVCPWKGTASYYSVVVGGDRGQDAAWYYPEPKEAAAQVQDRVAFWRGVKVVEG